MRSVLDDLVGQPPFNRGQIAQVVILLQPPLSLPIAWFSCKIHLQLELLLCIRKRKHMFVCVCVPVCMCVESKELKVLLCLPARRTSPASNASHRKISFPRYHTALVSLQATLATVGFYDMGIAAFVLSGLR